MSGCGGVASRERLRLASYPAVPASLAGCRCQARDAGLFRLAGSPSRPDRAVGQPGWGGKPSPVAPAPLDVFSIPAAASARSPQGLALPEPPLPCAARRPLLLSLGAAAAAAAATERTRPAPRARGEGAGIGGDTPSEAGGGFSLSHFELSCSQPEPSRFHPSQPPRSPAVSLFPLPWRQAFRAREKSSGELSCWPVAPEKELRSGVCMCSVRQESLFKKKKN